MIGPLLEHIFATVGTDVIVGTHCFATMGTDAIVGTLATVNRSQCWGTLLQQLEQTSLFSHNSDFGSHRNNDVGHHFCLCYSFLVRVTLVHSFFKPWSDATS
jgi:hypothetical protein